MEQQLYAAIERGDVKEAQSLLPRVVTNATVKQHTLVLSSQHGLAPIVQSVLQDFDWTEEEKKQHCHEALLRAVEHRHRDCVKVLSEHGVDPNYVNSKSTEPALITAVKQPDNDGIVEELLQMKASPNELYGEIGSAIHIVAESGNYKYLKLLITHGANVNLMNGKNDTALHIAAKFVNSPWHTECVKILVEQGAQYLLFNRDNQTAVMLAIECDNDKMLTFLLEDGLPVVTQYNDDTLDTLLHKVIRNNKMRCFLALVPVLTTEDVNRTNRQGDTPLHLLAPHKGYVQSAYSLMRYNPDLSVRNTAGKTPYQIAVEAKNWRMAEIIKGDNQFEPGMGWLKAFCGQQVKYFATMVFS